MTPAANQRAFDHLVLCVKDLDAARATYEALGFTATPTAVHPFGTGNVLIQLRDCFLELLAVVDPEKIAGPAPGGFSFGDYARRFLDKGEGFSMLALPTGDAAADREAFAAAGLDTYRLFEFQREARQPDGSTVTLAFALAFVTAPRMPEAVFFCCQHKHPPEAFWKPAYQRHANGATGVAAVIMVADDPGSFAEFFRRVQGDRAGDVMTDLQGIRCGRDRVVMLTPERFEHLYPGTNRTHLRATPGFAAFRIVVPETGPVRERLVSRGIRFREIERDHRLWIDADSAFGTLIEFVASPS